MTNFDIAADDVAAPRRSGAGTGVPARFAAVAGYLKAHGLHAQSVSVTGRGSADPVASNATVEGRASNRRVDISLQR